MTTKTNGNADTAKLRDEIVGDAEVFSYESVYTVPMAKSAYKSGASVLVETSSGKVQRVVLGAVVKTERRLGMECVNVLPSSYETLFDPKKSS